MADRSDYLPLDRLKVRGSGGRWDGSRLGEASRISHLSRAPLSFLQELAAQIEPSLQIEPQAEQVCEHLGF